jgi:hypothetical protein
MPHVQLPALEGTTLSGRQVRFPAELPEVGLALVFGFTHSSRQDVGAWKKALADRELSFLSLPTAAMDVAALEMAAVAEAMRAHVPREAWDQVVQIHQGGEALRRVFEWQADDFAKVVRVTSEGSVLMRHDSGPFTKEALAAFLG